jgi:hypothetical protein
MPEKTVMKPRGPTPTSTPVAAKDAGRRTAGIETHNEMQTQERDRPV